MYNIKLAFILQCINGYFILIKNTLYTKYDLYYIMVFKIYTFVKEFRFYEKTAGVDFLSAY